MLQTDLCMGGYTALDLRRSSNITLCQCVHACMCVCVCVCVCVHRVMHDTFYNTITNNMYSVCKCMYSALQCLCVCSVCRLVYKCAVCVSPPLTNTKMVPEL